MSKIKKILNQHADCLADAMNGSQMSDVYAIPCCYALDPVPTECHSVVLFFHESLSFHEEPIERHAVA